MEVSSSFSIGFLVPARMDAEQKHNFKSVAQEAEDNPTFESKLLNVEGVAYTPPPPLDLMALTNFEHDVPLSERTSQVELAQGITAYKQAALERDAIPNLETLSRRMNEISEEFSKALFENGIPKAPDTFTFDSDGRLQIPDSYEQIDELRNLFKEKPSIKQNLEAIHAYANAYLDKEWQTHNLSESLLNDGRTLLELAPRGHIRGFSILA